MMKFIYSIFKVKKEFKKDAYTQFCIIQGVKLSVTE